MTESDWLKRSGYASVSWSSIDVPARHSSWLVSWHRANMTYIHKLWTIHNDHLHSYNLDKNQRDLWKRLYQKAMALQRHKEETSPRHHDILYRNDPETLFKSWGVTELQNYITMAEEGIERSKEMAEHQASTNSLPIHHFFPANNSAADAPPIDRLIHDHPSKKKKRRKRPGAKASSTAKHTTQTNLSHLILDHDRPRNPPRPRTTTPTDSETTDAPSRPTSRQTSLLHFRLDPTH